jgi:hypothetical protein
MGIGAGDRRAITNPRRMMFALRGKFCAVPDIARAYPLPFLLRESNWEYKIPRIRKKLVIKRFNFG